MCHRAGAVQQDMDSRIQSPDFTYCLNTCALPVARRCSRWPSSLPLRLVRLRHKTLVCSRALKRVWRALLTRLQAASCAGSNLWRGQRCSTSIAVCGRQFFDCFRQASSCFAMRSPSSAGKPVLSPSRACASVSCGVEMFCCDRKLHFFDSRQPVDLHL